MNKRKGDNTTQEQAFASLAKRLRPKLVRVAQGIVCDPHAAEDVVQETLALIWARSDRWPTRLEAYTLRAVRNNALKRRLRERSFVDLAAMEFSMPDIDSGDQELDPALLEAALQGLPPTQQAVIRMRYYSDMSFRQISQALSISINTAASRCRYGLNNLRGALADKGRLSTRKDDQHE